MNSEDTFKLIDARLGEAIASLKECGGSEAAAHAFILQASNAAWYAARVLSNHRLKGKDAHREANEKYVGNMGQVCPVCKRDEDVIHSVYFDVDDGVVAHRTAWCDGCGSGWIENFCLEGFIVTRYGDGYTPA